MRMNSPLSDELMNKREKDAKLETGMGRGGWEWIRKGLLAAESVTAAMGSVQHSAWALRHGYVWHGTEQFPSEATDQECCSAHHATKMYEIALAEKQDFWVLSQKDFFSLLDECSPLIEQLLPSLFLPESGFYNS